MKQTFEKKYIQQTGATCVILKQNLVFVDGQMRKQNQEMWSNDAQCVRPIADAAADAAAAAVISRRWQIIYHMVRIYWRRVYLKRISWKEERTYLHIVILGLMFPSYCYQGKWRRICFRANLQGIKQYQTAAHSRNPIGQVHGWLEFGGIVNHF